MRQRGYRSVRRRARENSRFRAPFSGGDTEELEDAVDQMEEFAGNAPGEVKDEIATLSKAYEDYATTIRESGWKPGEVPTDEQSEALEEASETLESDDVKAAQATL